MKLKGLTGCLRKNIRNSWGSFSNLIGPRFGMDPTFAFGMTCGAEMCTIAMWL
jgi:hypothetical protein